MAAIVESQDKVGVEAFTGIPLILDGDRQICIVPSDFIRTRLIDEKRSPQSVENEAFLLRLLIRFLEHEGVPWERATNYNLRTCRDSLEKNVYKPWLRQTEYAGRGLPRRQKGYKRSIHCVCWERSTINSFLSLSFAFYVWAEENGHIHGVVDLKRGNPGIKYPIQSKMTKTGRLESNLLYATTKQSHRHTPTEAEIQILHEKAGGVIHTNRNTLIMTVYEETGLRREGALRELTVDKIPSYEKIEEMMDKNLNFVITVVEKGCKTRKVSVTPRLMLMLREFIDQDRSKIVDRYKIKPGWQEPKQVFLSDRGTPLNLVAFSNIMTKVFHHAGVVNASGHRLRAVFLVRLFLSFLDEKDSSGKTSDYDTILLKVAEAAGHSRPESLRPYLEFALRIRGLLSEAERSRKDSQAERDFARQTEQWTRRVGRSEAVTSMLRAISTGDEAAFTVAAKKVQEEMKPRKARLCSK